MNEVGNLFVVAAASGTGKTSLVHRLIECTDDIKISISHTTRPPRPDDKEGEAYFFVEEPAFEDMVNHHQFVEHAKVYGYQYGTSALWLQQQLQSGIDVILEIDWQGAAQIKRLKPDAALIFILPPSLDSLHERLEKRNQDKPHVIEERMKQAQAEISHYSEFDYIVVNDDFDTALDDLQSIVLAGRKKIENQVVRYQSLLEDLLQKQ
ncbi:MAG: guanylate kinase [Coxiellaceae bacterium]|nr:guanylate kinase [Coxiellaceae bacterium]